MAAPLKSYEAEQPWEQQRGSLAQRVVAVGLEAQRVYAQQEALLPTIHHDHALDPAIGDHLQDVGRRVQILHAHSKKADKIAQKIAERSGPMKRVIPSRYPEEYDDDEDAGNDGDADFVQGRLEIMLMDQEWDTRSWNRAKIQVAIQTLCDEVENSDDPRRRDLATSMLVRLLETHECAVEFIEVTIPILMNKAFKSLSKNVNKTKTFRVCVLMSVLSEWFAPILSRDNATAKCIKFLLREAEICARIVQHHWRGVMFERSLQRRQNSIDPSVRARLRSMHFVKNIELRHQFKVVRDAIGPEGMPIEAIRAYVQILYHLVKPKATAVDKHRHHSATADQKRVLGSGILSLLASFIPTHRANLLPSHVDHRRAITEDVKAIVVELALCFGDEPDKVVEIMKSNIIQRVISDMDQQRSLGNASYVESSMDVIAATTNAVWKSHNHFIRADALNEERVFVMHQVQRTAMQFLMTSQVMETLLCMLPLSRERKDAVMCERVLSTLRYLAGSHGFTMLLDALTRNGGRSLEQLLLCFDYDAGPEVVRAAVALYYEMSNHPDARGGFTTAGAVLLLARWCEGSIEATKNRPRFVLSMIGMALLARQHPSSHQKSPDKLLTSLGSMSQRMDALYAILLDLTSGSSRDTQHAALYLHQTTNVFVPIFLKLLTQVKPTGMEPAFQSPTQRSISCIVLGKFFKVPSVASACFCESTVLHLALSLQCNRLDEIEGKLRKSVTTTELRRLHVLALREACKALSRLCRCPPSAPGIDLSLRPTITSPNVPLLPQAIVCDVVTRTHALEDILPLIHMPTDAAEFPETDASTVHAAIELVGFMRPMPFGETARQKFLRTMNESAHAHGVYANEKLELLVTIAAPMILHVLKEKNCGQLLVATCCLALSRLAATNQCRTLLLKQGAMFIALTHVPEVLYDREAANKSRRSGGGSSSPIRCDASVDDAELTGVPASLFTLLAKLCHVDEGRTAMIKAQVLPRVLKRLQLIASTRLEDDLLIKSEIAVLLQRLAVCNTTEGNTSEMFLHFHVLDLLVQIVVQQTPKAVEPPRSPTKRNGSKSFEPHSLVSVWSVLDNVTGAIAALAHDVLVCVPKIVQLDLLTQVSPLLLIPPTGIDSHHLVALQHHVLNTTLAVASYPFGEYHAYLKRVRCGEELLLMEKVKRVAFDFTLELQGGTQDGQQTMGELARDVLAQVREHEQQNRLRERGTQLPASPTIKSRPPSPLPPAIPEPLCFPSLPGCPKLGSSASSANSPSAPIGSVNKPQQALAPMVSSATLARSNVVGGVDLLSTRPPPRAESQPQALYIFARPKVSTTNDRKTRKKSRDLDTLLMLDPLFQNTSPPPLQYNRQRRDSRERELTDADQGEEVGGFAFCQEIAHGGHQVNLRARRSKAGDKYIAALGLLEVEDTRMNALPRRR